MAHQLRFHEIFTANAYSITEKKQMKAVYRSSLCQNTLRYMRLPIHLEREK